MSDTLEERPVASTLQASPLLLFQLLLLGLLLSSSQHTFMASTDTPACCCCCAVASSCCPGWLRDCFCGDPSPLGAIQRSCCRSGSAGGSPRRLAGWLVLLISGGCSRECRTTREVSLAGSVPCDC